MTVITFNVYNSCSTFYNTNREEFKEKNYRKIKTNRQTKNGVGLISKQISQTIQPL